MIFVDLFLKSIFLVVLLTAIFLVGIVAYFYVRVRRMARDLHRAAGQSATGAGRGHHARSAAHGTAGTASGGSAPVDEQLYDERPESARQRKIFAKDEGEYVDFEEEK